MPPIWTLDSRNDQFLPIAVDYWNLSGSQVRDVILEMHSELTRILKGAGLEYSSFRNALIPQARKTERAFIFNSMLIDDAWYGGVIAQYVVSALDKEQFCSILAGDLIFRNQQAARAALQKTGVFYKKFDHVNTTMLHAVYVNNITETRARSLDERLRPHASYIGYIPAKYSSTAKEMISFVLSPVYLKAGRQWLCESEGETVMGTDNVPCWPLEDFGYACHSVPVHLWGPLLSYKIERAIYPGDENDTQLALAAISANPTDLAGFQVEVEPAKVEYLRQNKGGSLARAGLEELEVKELEAMIRNQIRRNYIYSLEYKHEKSFFNIMLEVGGRESSDPTKLLAAMEYQPEQNKLRLVTLF